MFSCLIVLGAEVLQQLGAAAESRGAAHTAGRHAETADTAAA